MSEFMYYFWVNFLESLAWSSGPVVAGLIILFILTKTEAGETYRSNYIETHFRALGLIAFVGALIYLSFFINLDPTEESEHTKNIFFSMRALSLGGLGALITLLASYVLIPLKNNSTNSSFINRSNYWSLLLGHTLMGAVVSVVILGLFYTKQLTVFQPDSASNGSVTPEFWRVTVLCIIAGAFAQNLYSGCLKSRG